jgi:hypothetical protein
MKFACVCCGESETPLWRFGPSGRRDHCNRCGVRYNRAKLAKSAGSRAKAEKPQKVYIDAVPWKPECFCYGEELGTADYYYTSGGALYEDMVMAVYTGMPPTAPANKAVAVAARAWADTPFRLATSE